MPSWRDGGGPDTCRGTKDRPPRKLKRSPPKKARQRIGQVEVPPQIPNMGGPCPNMGGCGEYKALSAAELATRATKAARAAARTQAQAAREGARAALEGDAARRIQQQALARQRRGRGAADEAVGTRELWNRELWNRELPCAQYGNDALVAIVQIWVDSTAWLAETWSHVEAETHIWKVRVHERLSLLQPAPAAAKPLRALHASAQYGATAKPLRALPSPDPDNLLERERRKWAEASRGMQVLSTAPSPDPDNLLERERRKWAEASHGMRVLSTAPPPDRNNLLERERRRWAAVALKAQGGLRLDLEGLNAFEAMTATMKELGCESGED